MSSSLATKKDIKHTKRGIIAFPEIEEFYDTLMDRLNMVMGHLLKDRYTLFINALPRNHEPVGEKIEINRFDIDTKLIYAGLKQQQAFITAEFPDIKIKQEHWTELKNADLTPATSKVSIHLFEMQRKGTYTLEDIDAGSLEQYFMPILKPEENHSPLTNLQIAEYYILNGFLEGAITDYYYVSVPLIQFAEFDGVVHIILSKEDYEREFTYREENTKKRRLSIRTVGRVIKAFSREFEGLILDWDIVGGAQLKEETYMDALINDDLYEYNDRDNPILKELEYKEYYKKHHQYFENRFEYSRKVPLAIRQQYRKIAIMHILIDSYAHNISAHSLTALEWWFKLRADTAYKKELKKIGLTATKPTLSQIALLNNQEVSLDKDIHPLLRFFLDKGAFWTGLTRDTSFGGQIKNLYDVLWQDFINNPLYLGTIAFTEGILKINIHITFLRIISHQQHIEVTKEVELDGLFAQIDLTEFYKATSKYEVEQLTNFVKPSKDFYRIRTKLRNCKAYFPGGVVGIHAFFTILENELRNVKHYSKKALAEIRKTGLTLNLSIEETSYDTISPLREKEKHYFKIGVWLRHPIDLTKELLLKRPEKLNSDIMERAEKDFRPKLGGTYQDKVCAAMLFTNSFNKIEDKFTTRGKQFYPWVKAGYSTFIEQSHKTIIDWELSARRMFGAAPELVLSREHFNEYFEEQKGYFKKFIHLWKGEDIYQLKDASTLDSESENISRFRFVCLPKDSIENFRKVREAGIIRVLNQSIQEEETAYYYWLQEWLNKEKSEDFEYRIEFSEKSDIQNQLEINASAIVFRNDEEILDNKLEHFQEINLLHKEEQADLSGNEAIRYKNHGIFKKYFYKGNKTVGYTIPADRRGELLEVLGTSVCIFDNRLAKRFENVETSVLEEQLYCKVHHEDKYKWEEVKKLGFFQYHFLVVHLSFIEALKDPKSDKNYNEDDIRSFIEQEILQGKEPPKNFILVIITGRGRTEWSKTLKGDRLVVNPNSIPYTSFVTFRPVESLTAAIEFALAMPDDMELKYRLVKILFGS